MAYPGTYNFNYYKGDTFEFKIYPKTSTGSAFDLTSYATQNGGSGAAFTMSTQRGAAGVSSQVSGVATINLSDNSITCTIRPTDGLLLNANNNYVYDVEISKGSGNSRIVYTLLTGIIEVEDHVTGATA